MQGNERHGNEVQALELTVAFQGRAVQPGPGKVCPRNGRGADAPGPSVVGAVWSVRWVWASLYGFSIVGKVLCL